jgi:outer membrane protein assembly factor BamB
MHMKCSHLPHRFIEVLLAVVIAGCSGGGGDSNSSSSAPASGASGAAPAPASAASEVAPASSASGAASSPVIASGMPAASSPSMPSTPVVNAADVATYHNDVARTGQHLDETALTPATVNSATFGKLGFYSADGLVDAEPLYLSNVTIAGGTHNVLYVATENASVYAFDADTGATLWKTTTLASGETPSDSLGCFQISPTIGVTATPVIDRSRGPNGAMYVVGMSKTAAGAYHQRIHALDVTTGAELFGGPTEITASYPGTGANSSNGNVIFDPKQYAERQSLLLLNGTIYTAWTSHCDVQPYTGWVIAYSADTLKQTSVLNLTPNGSGGAIWMSGAGMASDGTSIYLLDANGSFDATVNAAGVQVSGDYGNAFLKLGTTTGLTVADYFEASNTIQESAADEDLGSGGALVLPDLTDAAGTVHHLALGAGKDAIIYVVNRDSMGKYNPVADAIYQELAGQISGRVFSMPAYFNNTVYFGAVGDTIKAFSISGARLSATPASHSPTTFGAPGATPSISANGTSNGIVWAAENGTTGVLHAYDATNLGNELYNSNQAGSRDQFGAGNKFITPMITNGKVYVGTTNGVAVFGLLGSH